MKMQHLQHAVALGLLLVSGPVFAASEDPIQRACSNGAPWALPKTEPPFSVSELYLRLNGGSGPIRVCHCTEDVDGKSLFVWVVSNGSSTASVSKASLDALAAQGRTTAKIDDNMVSLLRGRGCLDADGHSIQVHHEDNKNGRWGTYYFPIPN